MKNFACFGILLLAGIHSFAQINMNDSTVQVIGYWDKNEKQSYIVTNEKYKVNDYDTTDRVFTKYLVDISIADSTADSYIINWYYHNNEINTDNELLKKLSSIVDDMTIKIKTDALGVFQEVVNWVEIRDYILKATKILRQEMKDIPNINQIADQIESTYNTKESIEASAINEIHQYYAFHGIKYKLGEEAVSSVKLTNLFGGNPFDAEITYSLDEINADNNNSVLRMKNMVNSEQLTKATFDYLTQLSEINKTEAPKWEEFSPLKNETWTASRIHDSGWVIYSVETKEVSSEGVVNVDETIIDIQ